MTKLLSGRALIIATVFLLVAGGSYLFGENRGYRDAEKHFFNRGYKIGYANAKNDIEKRIEMERKKALEQKRAEIIRNRNQYQKDEGERKAFALKVNNSSMEQLEAYEAQLKEYQGLFGFLDIAPTVK